MSMDPKAAKRLSWVLVALAFALLILHFALDAGDDREAPDSLLMIGIAVALAATFAGLHGERKERR